MLAQHTDMLDDALQKGVAIGDRAALWCILRKLTPAELPPELDFSAWQPHASEDSGAGGSADAVVRGMFEMLCNHLTSPQAQASFSPLQLLVLLRGDDKAFDAFVMTLGSAGEGLQQHLMVLRPAVFVMLADRFLRALTCADIWPELGDPSTCQSSWVDVPLSNQPSDPERFQLAMNMAMLAALIVFYHELAHIIRGHNAFYSSPGTDLGAGTLRENMMLSMSSDKVGSPDITRRALEVDADIYAGVFLAATLRLGALGEITDESLPHWCELMAQVATITFNVFEEQVLKGGYRQGYHLPSTRTECFLEGLASGLDVTDNSLFAAGANAGFEFCAKHYRAPGSLTEIEADIADLKQDTLPHLHTLRPLFGKHVPLDWLKRGEG